MHARCAFLAQLHVEATMSNSFLASGSLIRNARFIDLSYVMHRLVILFCLRWGKQRLQCRSKSTRILDRRNIIMWSSSSFFLIWIGVITLLTLSFLSTSTAYSIQLKLLLDSVLYVLSYYPLPKFKQYSLCPLSVSLSASFSLYLCYTRS